MNAASGRLVCGSACSDELSTSDCPCWAMSALKIMQISLAFIVAIHLAIRLWVALHNGVLSPVHIKN